MAFEAVILIIAALILLMGALAFFAFRVQREEYLRTGKHPKGHYLGLGVALGVAIGIPLGAAMDMVALGPSIGVGIGLALGAAMEKRHEQELRPPTPREVEMKNKLVITLLFFALLGLAAFFYFSLYA